MDLKLESQSDLCDAIDDEEYEECGSDDYTICGLDCDMENYFSPMVRGCSPMD